MTQIQKPHSEHEPIVSWTTREFENRQWVTAERYEELVEMHANLLEQFEALARVILEADTRTQQPIDLNYIAIFKDDWHRIVGKVTPPAKLADLFVSNPASTPDGSE